MAKLECSEHDCCNNRAGCCCLDAISVIEEGENEKEAVCCSYCCDSGMTDHVGAENASPETEIRCNEKKCCHNQNCCCQAEKVSIDECSCGPECKTFEKK